VLLSCGWPAPHTRRTVAASHRTSIIAKSGRIIRREIVARSGKLLQLGPGRIVLPRIMVRIHATKAFNLVSLTFVQHRGNRGFRIYLGA